MTTRRQVLIGAAAVTAFGRAATAQVTSTAGEILLHQEGRYLPRWLELLDSPALQGLKEQYAAFLGDEATALARAAPPATVAMRLGAEARASDALQRIAAASGGRRLVMLNEAHVASRHRSFLAQVLRALRPLGFTHLAAETFTNQLGDAPSARDFRSGEPWNPAFGFYTKDPVYAEAVREAVELGFKLVPYEMRADQFDWNETDVSVRIRNREEAQARNLISAVLEPEPQARVLVFVGYSHLRETPDRAGNVWLAARLKENTGLDPLTIEQSATGSFSPHARDHPLADEALRRFRPSASIVVDDEGEVMGAARAGADLAVLHPASTDLDGRPGWLAADPMRRLAVIELPGDPSRDGPVLLQAIHAHDPDVTTPADQYLLPPAAGKGVLWLRPGRYRVRLETLSGFRGLDDEIIVPA